MIDPWGLLHKSPFTHEGNYLIVQSEYYLVLGTYWNGGGFPYLDLENNIAP